MKKILALALALSMALSLVACSNGTENTSNGGGSNGGGSSASIPDGSAGGDSEKGLTADERAGEFITVGTGPTSGIYFPIGGAFATALRTGAIRPALSPPTPLDRTSRICSTVI